MVNDFVYAHMHTRRGVNSTPPLPRSNPPSVPPRNRHTSEGEHPLPNSLGSSPNDRAFWGSNGRMRTPSSTGVCVCVCVCVRIS